MAHFFADTTNEISKRELDNMALSRKLAGECVVLLENDGSLPLKNAGKIALYGNGARNTIKGGTGSGDVNSRNVVNIEQGFDEAGLTVTTKDWLDAFDAKKKKDLDDYMAEMQRIAAEEQKEVFVVVFDHPHKEACAQLITEEDVKKSDTDTAVYVVSRQAGEGGDRKAEDGDYEFYPDELSNLKFLGAHYAKVILVLNIGGLINLTPVRSIDGISAVVLMTQLGNIGGYVLADVLLGKVNPSGKTTDTWAKDYYDYPSSKNFSHNNGNVSDEYYEDGIFVGYRYFDSFGVEPNYPFGYGLSYTDFTVTPGQVTQEGAELHVKATVENTGKNFAGKEVVQVYVSVPDGEEINPYQMLSGYQKTHLLAPSEKEEVEIVFPIKHLASYSTKKAAWILNAGEYVVRVGNSSRNTTPAAVLTVEKDFVTEQCRNLFPLDCELKEIAPKACNKKADAPCRLTVRMDALVTETYTYVDEHKEMTTDKTEKLTMADILAGRCTVEDLIAQLTVEEMAEFCVGTSRAEDGSIVGNASNQIPGAAGDTAKNLFESRGIRGLSLPDGPAGLRLIPHFRANDAGDVEMSYGLGSLLEDLKGETKEGWTDYYQYATAIPIGWALAQSWNPSLVEQIGHMVGGEMEHFGCDVWLAPAMNIHRNPLCGRNFEYYSEDPLVSGLTAAAMTKGVQSVKGRGTCIKHYAVNNQEENRYYCNEHVSERALREIYLKGFGVCVRESQPLSVMSSYNLINGIHAACNKDSIQHVLRDEFGFEGFVMTDWFTTQFIPMLTGKYEPKYPISASSGCIYAGNDSQQPGCQKNVDDIVKAVNSGKEYDGFTITKGDLQFNAANILRTIVRCDK